MAILNARAAAQLKALVSLKQKTKTRRTSRTDNERSMSRVNWQFPRRRERREQAAVRQTEYEALSLNQKLDRCDQRRGESKKERRKLLETRAD